MRYEPKRILLIEDDVSDDVVGDLQGSRDFPAKKVMHIA